MNIARVKAKLTNNPTTIILSIWLIATILNINKGFHIDDAFHIEAAQWIEHYPLRPMSGLINWDNSSAPLHLYNQPPLYFYLLAVVGSTFGYSEVPLHLFQSIFTLLSLFFFYKLLCIYNSDFAIWGTIILSLGPAFLVNQNLMVDIPILALSIIFIYLLIKEDSSHETRNVYLAAIMLSIGLLIKYTLLPLLFVLLLKVIQKRNWKLLPAFFIPLFFIFIWTIFNYLEIGYSHLGGRPRNALSVEDVFFDITTFLITLGSLSPFSLLFLNGFLKGKSWRYITVLVIASIVLTLGVYLLVFGLEVKSIPHKLFWVMFLGNGLLLSIVFVMAAKDKSNHYASQVIILWAVSQTIFIVLLAPFMATRHVLLIIPPLILICSHFYKQASAKVTIISIAMTCFLGVALGVSDWFYADFYRKSAREAMNLIPSHKKVWSIGHWGWQWYSKQAGMTFFETKLSNVAKGDYVVMPSVVPKQQWETDLELEKEVSIIYQPSVWNFFTTANFASFYNTDHTQLPWYVSITSVDTVSIYRVKRIIGNKE